MKQVVSSLFSERYDSRPMIVRSPGRINLIGEHTDYNEGFVLPAAIDKSIYVAVDKREDRKIVLFSQHYNEEEQFDLAPLTQSEKRWPNYVLGVVDQLQKRGYTIGGFSMVIDGDVPLGSGLSSSAAVECAAMGALNELFGLGIDRLDRIKMAQLAEQRFIGVKCGIMDQFASVCGRKDHAIRLDCRSLQSEFIPLDLKGYRIILFNTNIRHSLASSEYNTRRAQCEQGVTWVREHHPSVRSLRDVSPDMLEKYVWPNNETIFKRCQFVLDENARLLECCEDLKKGDILAFGKKMFLSHKGLKEAYEVSCRELDWLVDQVKASNAVAGARMMGGGFGGCTINLVRENAMEELIQRLTFKYMEEMKLPLGISIVETGDGTEVLSYGATDPIYVTSPSGELKRQFNG